MDSDFLQQGFDDPSNVSLYTFEQQTGYVNDAIARMKEIVEGAGGIWSPQNEDQYAMALWSGLWRGEYESDLEEMFGPPPTSLTQTLDNDGDQDQESEEDRDDGGGSPLPPLPDPGEEETPPTPGGDSSDEAAGDKVDVVDQEGDGSSWNNQYGGGTGGSGGGGGEGGEMHDPSYKGGAGGNDLANAHGYDITSAAEVQGTGEVGGAMAPFQGSKVTEVLLPLRPSIIAALDFLSLDKSYDPNEPPGNKFNPNSRTVRELLQFQLNRNKLLHQTVREIIGKLKNYVSPKEGSTPKMDWASLKSNFTKCKEQLRHHTRLSIYLLGWIQTMERVLDPTDVIANFYGSNQNFLTAYSKYPFAGPVSQSGLTGKPWPLGNPTLTNSYAAKLLIEFGCFESSTVASMSKTRVVGQLLYDLYDACHGWSSALFGYGKPPWRENGETPPKGHQPGHYDYHYSINKLTDPSPGTDPTGPGFIKLIDFGWKKAQTGNFFPPHIVSTIEGFYAFQNGLPGIGQDGYFDLDNYFSHRVKILIMMLSREFSVSAGLTRALTIGIPSAPYRHLITRRRPFDRIIGDVSRTATWDPDDQNLMLQSLDFDWSNEGTPVSSPMAYTSVAERGIGLSKLTMVGGGGNNTWDSTSVPRTILGHAVVSNASMATVGPDLNVAVFEDRVLVKGNNTWVPGAELFFKPLLNPPPEGQFLNTAPFLGWATSYKNTCSDAGQMINVLMGDGAGLAAFSDQVNTPTHVYRTFLKNWRDFMFTISERGGFDDPEYAGGATQLGSGGPTTGDFEGWGPKGFDLPVSWASHIYANGGISKAAGGAPSDYLGFSLANLVTMIIFRAVYQADPVAYDAAGASSTGQHISWPTGTNLRYLLWKAWRQATRLQRAKSYSGQAMYATNIAGISGLDDFEKTSPTSSATNQGIESMLYGKFKSVSADGTPSVSEFTDVATVYGTLSAAEEAAGVNKAWSTELLGEDNVIQTYTLAFYATIDELTSKLVESFMFIRPDGDGGVSGPTGESWWRLGHVGNEMAYTTAGIDASYLLESTHAITSPGYVGGEGGNINELTVNTDAFIYSAQEDFNAGYVDADFVSLWGMFEGAADGGYLDVSPTEAFRQYLAEHLKDGLGFYWKTPDALVLGEFMNQCLGTFEQGAAQVAGIDTELGTYLSPHHAATFAIPNGDIITPRLTAFNGLDEDTLSAFVFQVWMDFLAKYPSGYMHGHVVTPGENTLLFDSNNQSASKWHAWEIAGLPEKAAGSVQAFSIDPDVEGFELASDNPNPGWIGQPEGLWIDKTKAEEDAVWVGWSLAVGPQSNAKEAVGVRMRTNSEVNRQLTIYLNSLYEWYAEHTHRDGMPYLNNDPSFSTWVLGLWETWDKFSMLYTPNDWQSDYIASMTGPVSKAVAQEKMSKMLEMQQDGTSAEKQALVTNVMVNAKTFGWNHLDSMMQDFRREEAWIRAATSFFSAHSVGCFNTAVDFAIAVEEPVEQGHTFWKSTGIANTSIRSMLNTSTGNYSAGPSADDIREFTRSRFRELNVIQAWLVDKRYRDLISVKAKSDNHQGIYMMPDQVLDYQDISSAGKKSLNLRMMRGILGQDSEQWQFSNAESRNLKIFFIGLPRGTIDKLRRSPINIAPGSSDDEIDRLRRSTSTLVRVAIHRQDFSHPDLIFEPINFTFDTHVFPKLKFWSGQAQQFEDETMVPTLSYVVSQTDFVRYKTFVPFVQQMYTGANNPKASMLKQTASGEELAPFLENDWNDDKPWGDVGPGSNSVWQLLGPNSRKTILENHVVSEVLMMYYRTLCGLHFGEQTYIDPQNGFGGDFTNHLNVDEKGYKFLLAADANKGLGSDSFKTSTVLTTGIAGMANLFHGSVDNPDQQLPALVRYDQQPPPPGSHAPDADPPDFGRVKRLKSNYEGILSKDYPPAPFKVFKCLLQSGLFQANNIVWGASAIKEFDRVFAVPIDIDAFIVSPLNNTDEVINKYFNSGNPAGNILAVLPAAHPAYGSYPEGTTLYKVKYASTIPEPVGNPQDFVFADQFFVQFGLVEQPGIGSGAASFNHGFDPGYEGVM